MDPATATALEEVLATGVDCWKDIEAAIAASTARLGAIDVSGVPAEEIAPINEAKAVTMQLGKNAIAIFREAIPK